MRLAIFTTALLCGSAGWAQEDADETDWAAPHAKTVAPDSSLLAKLPLTIQGHVDFGFFVPVGNRGVGYVQDFGNQLMPSLAGRYAWVFLGDILATAVNSRGEAADLGDATAANRYDGIHSNGAPGFIVNVVQLGARAALGETVLLTLGLNFTPRTGSNFSLGDVLDVDLAQLEWTPTDDRRISIFAGKMESAIGIEYRDRRSTSRFGITPSLIARYTTGTPLGVKVRAKFFPGDFLTAALALTNGSSTTEQFHFFDETDSNAGKTVSGRVSLKPTAFLHGFGDLEVGFSGQWGATDRALDSLHAMWFIGVDALWSVGPVVVKAQWLRGFADGPPDDRVYRLKLNGGGYVEVDWNVTPLFGLLARGEFRDAVVTLGSERAYITRSWRATLGARLTFNANISLKAEYLLNGEYGGIPFIPNDIFTSSLVAGF